MFREVLNSTPLTSDEANRCFGNWIDGDCYKDDDSFVATLRFLLNDRADKNSNIYFRARTCSHSRGILNIYDSRTVLNDIYNPAAYANDSITLIMFSRALETDRNAIFNFICEHFTETNNEFIRVNKVTDFYRSMFQCACFIDAEHKKTVMFVGQELTMQKYHYLQCGIIAYIPWYFPKEKGVSKEEMDLIESLRMKTSEKYIEILASFAKKADFRTNSIKQLLSGFEIRADKARLLMTQADIEGLIDSINSLNEQIGDYLRKKSDKEIIVMGLNAKIAEYNDDDSEIMDYFLRNKKIYLRRVTDNTMVFCVKDYCDYFDEDMIAHVLENRRSYIYTTKGASDIPTNEMQKLMKAIFVDQTLKLQMCSTYKFDLRGSVSGVNDFQYDYNFMDAMPNPHIDRYQCLGNYSRMINEYLKRHDYIGAIEQCVASTKSLNFGDSAVMEEFMKLMYGVSNHRNLAKINYIELPDGTMTDPRGAIKYLHEQEKETENE